MAKDYAKFVPAKSRKPKRKVRLLTLFIAIFFGIFICLAIGYFSLVAHKRLSFVAGNPKINSVIAKAVALLHYKKDGLNKEAKRLNDNQENYTPQIHFDFYTELPNRELQVAEKVNNGKNTNGSVQYSVKLQSTLPLQTTTQESAQPQPKQEVQPVEATNEVQSSIFKPEDISTQMATEINQQYVINLGVFETEEAANRLLDVLSSVGFQSQVIKANQGKSIIFRVQQGPFSSRELAKATQLRLKKRGITGVIQVL